MTDKDIREEVDTFLFEGHDTSSIAITMAIIHLGLDQNIQVSKIETKKYYQRILYYIHQHIMHIKFKKYLKRTFIITISDQKNCLNSIILLFVHIFFYSYTKGKHGNSYEMLVIYFMLMTAVLFFLFFFVCGDLFFFYSICDFKQNLVRDELFEIFGDSNRDATMEDLKAMTNLERVIKETMRLYPSVTGITRTLKEPLHLGMCTI